jgi:hypothetical protein
LCYPPGRHGDIDVAARLRFASDRVARIGGLETAHAATVLGRRARLAEIKGMPRTSRKVTGIRFESRVRSPLSINRAAIVGGAGRRRRTAASA